MQRKCYPYIRFSSKKQEFGTSYARQSDIESFLERHSLVVDTTLEDLGVSAFRGKNATQGQLGGFIDLVQSGLVEPNSILLIENFDRLSRQKIIKSTRIFIDLLSQGIDIAILDTGKIYTRENLISSDFFNVIIEFDRANKESERKSDFTSSAWNIYRKEMRSLKIPKTRKTPSWISVEGSIRNKDPEKSDARFVVVENEARKIRKMFELALTNGLSETARLLNEWLEPEEKKYSIHQVQYLLKNRKVIGEHQPMKFQENEQGEMKLFPEGSTIENYYPSIISKEIFDEVQEKTTGRKPFAGKFNKTRLNVFQGFIYCYHCNGTIRYMDKSSEERPNKHYYICTNSMTGKCTLSHRLSYDASEAMQNFFEKTEKLNMTEIFNNDEKILGLNKQIKTVESNITKKEKQGSNLKRQIREAVEKGKDIPDFLTDLLLENEQDLKALAVELQQLIETKNRHIEQQEISKSFSQENIHSLLNDRTDDGVRKRIQINNHLRKIVKQIHFFWRKKPGGKRGIGIPTMLIEFQNGIKRFVLEDEFTLDSDSSNIAIIEQVLQETHELYLKK